MNLAALKERLQHCYDLEAAESKDHLIPICEALRGLGVASVEARYWGGGDDGAVEEVAYLPDGTTVPDDLDECVQSWIEATLPFGWEIDNGAQGAVRVDVVAVTAHFDHKSNVMTTKDESFDIGGEEA